MINVDRGNYRDLILVLNSAVNPLAYAFFKADLKREINKIFCKVAVERKAVNV